MVEAGKTYDRVVAEITNVGAVAATDIDVDIVLSKTENVPIAYMPASTEDTDPRLLIGGRTHIQDLPANSAVQVDFPKSGSTIPYQFDCNHRPYAHRWLAVIVDSGDKIRETVETNNFDARYVTVHTREPELKIIDVVRSAENIAFRLANRAVTDLPPDARAAFHFEMYCNDVFIGYDAFSCSRADRPCPYFPDQNFRIARGITEVQLDSGQHTYCSGPAVVVVTKICWQFPGTTEYCDYPAKQFGVPGL